MVADSGGRRAGKGVPHRSEARYSDSRGRVMTYVLQAEFGYGASTCENVTSFVLGKMQRAQRRFARNLRCASVWHALQRLPSWALAEGGFDVERRSFAFEVPASKSEVTASKFSEMIAMAANQGHITIQSGVFIKG